MNRKQGILIGILALLGLVAGAIILRTEKRTGGEGGEHGGAAKEQVVKGPHRGRLLADGDFQIELTIFETGVPPIFRAYPFVGDAPIDPGQVGLVVSVHRLGGQVDTVRFKKEADYLAGDQIVVEPHSFTVKVSADYQGKTHRWEYTQLEGRLHLPGEALASSSVRIVTAGPAVIRSVLTLNGKVMPNEDRLVHVRARFPGMLKEVRKRLGERVQKGDVLALVESNESLQTYEVRAQMSGTIIEKDASIGESVTDNQVLYVVADLGTVWVDLSVYRKDFAKLRKGQAVRVDAGDGSDPAPSTISYISPFGTENTQTMLARAELDNKAGDWRPGLFVKAEVTLESAQVPLAVEAEALQTFRDWNVVFIQDGEEYEVRPLELGRHDGKYIEVLEGIRPGARYASGNSFLLKAELGKAGATHDH
jgi:cobalt-zinc-cadmium efflux system membrane fusion protein